ncbi:uncharacterized protein LOC131682750 [Topomyia yanbarensis]|uniref:uncharacterized protein LOC131682750 n=1 Tax=Topomyia yanbarensis TaxID=2498891 RepID=UPI00273C6EFC|nr:uncharacterized protein LOC131682750 [Topomyia yanbarensis]
MQPIFGIYEQKNCYYVLKFGVMWCLLIIRKIRQTLFRIFGKQYDESKYANLEKPQPLSSNVHAVDAVYFNGTNSKLSWLVCGTARRKNNLVNGFLYLKVSDFSEKLLVSPRLPDTCMIQTEAELGSYEAEGLKLTPLKPMKSWKIEYTGKMRYENDYSQDIDVKLDATWTSDLPYFNFASDMDSKSVARAMAKEQWTREHFKNLKKYHQTHYEHFGAINGKVKINGTNYPLTLDCMRDHSFGEQRDWKNFHRYVMHFIHLENGDRITVGVICMPITFSSLEAGFVSLARERCNYPITSVNFNLYQHGEQGSPPIDYAFQFTTGKEVYVVKVLAVACPEFYIGKDSECRIVEQLCNFEVNGLKGWGAAEWQYKNFDGFPVLLTNKVIAK